MSLQSEISKNSALIRTDSYPMSIGELANLYRDKEIDVHPEFQRVFRWSIQQKSRLIESILLGIPIPPIFVSQRKDGVWDVVDGQQRLSTIFQFMGILRDTDDSPLPPLVLEETRILPSLEGKTWDNNKSSSFTTEQRLYVKRSRIDVNIVLKESSDTSKYELFMRLNTGGSALQPQEVRNCLMLMAYSDTYEFIRELAANEDFLNSIAVSERSIEEQFPMELVTRFLSLRTLPENAGEGEACLKRIGDMGDFLNDQLPLIHAWSSEKRKVEITAFNETFSRIYSEIGGDAFRRYDNSDKKFKGGFLLSGFEAVAIGIGYNTNKSGRLKSIADLLGKVKKLWDDPSFTNKTGSGVRASSRIPQIVPLGRKLFSR